MYNNSNNNLFLNYDKKYDTEIIIIHERYVEADKTEARLEPGIEELTPAYA